MQVGDCFELSKVFDHKDVKELCRLAGAEPPEDTLPAPLIAALFSRVLGMHLPGPGTNYLKQELRFAAQAAIGDQLTVSAEITRLRSDKNLIDLMLRCYRADGALVCEGRALVKYPG